MWHAEACAAIEARDPSIILCSATNTIIYPPFRYDVCTAHRDIQIERENERGGGRVRREWGIQDGKREPFELRAYTKRRPVYNNM